MLSDSCTQSEHSGEQEECSNLQMQSMSGCVDQNCNFGTGLFCVGPEEPEEKLDSEVKNTYLNYLASLEQQIEYEH